MQNPQKELYDILLSKDFDVDTLNNTGKSVNALRSLSSSGIGYPAESKLFMISPLILHRKEMTTEQ